MDNEHNKIKQKLEKLNAKVVKTTVDRIYVIYNQKGKTKLAYFATNLPYHDRYGPQVISTYNGSRFWFMSNDIANSISDIELIEMELVFFGNSTLPNFEVDTLGILSF